MTAKTGTKSLGMIAETGTEITWNNTFNWDKIIWNNCWNRDRNHLEQYLKLEQDHLEWTKITWNDYWNRDRNHLEWSLKEWQKSSTGTKLTWNNCWNRDRNHMAWPLKRWQKSLEMITKMETEIAWNLPQENIFQKGNHISLELPFTVPPCLQTPLSKSQFRRGGLSGHHWHYYPNSMLTAKRLIMWTVFGDCITARAAAQC